MVSVNKKAICTNAPKSDRRVGPHYIPGCGGLRKQGSVSTLPWLSQRKEAHHSKQVKDHFSKVSLADPGL